MYIRGLQTLNGNNGILLVVDGLERDNNWQVLNYITPEEVESVSVLRDAAAVALYGYRGINGVVNVVTKRGKYKTREINFSYDHSFDYQTRVPEMADAYTYASAVMKPIPMQVNLPGIHRMSWMLIKVVNIHIYIRM